MKENTQNILSNLKVGEGILNKPPTEKRRRKKRGKDWTTKP